MRQEIEKIVKDQVLDLFGVDVEVEITHPPSPELGDYSTNVAFNLSGEVDKSPEDIAELISDRIEDSILNSTRAVNGFINFKVEKHAWIDELRKSVEEDYGDSGMGEDNNVLLEFVSANPTGPIHVAHARASAFGDSLARILKSQGFSVEKEYYLNDTGKQVNLLGKSIKMREKEIRGEKVEFPEDGYKGEYVKKLAEMSINENPSDYSSFGVEKILDMIKKTLKRFRVEFDSWVSEKKLYEDGKVEKVIDNIKEKKEESIFEKEGALWFDGEERERVFVRSDGSYTYVVPDIAYHRNKFERGFDILIDLLGPDHIDHVPEIKAALGLLGYPEEKLEVKIIQWVTLKRGENKLKMSKRSGEFVTIDELLDEVGVDAARFLFLTRRSSAPMDFDIELASEQSERNPVYYVQYGHARICSLLDLAREEGYDDIKDANLEKIEGNEEWMIIKKIPEFKEVLQDSARIREPHLLAHYLIDISKIYHNFYQKVRVIGGEKELTLPRLFLSMAVRNVVERGLNLLGVSAPRRM